MHNLEVADVVRCDEDNCGARGSVVSVRAEVMVTPTFSAERIVCFLQDLHGVWAATPDLRVPQQETLGLNVTVDQATDGRTEGLLLVRAYRKAKDRQRLPSIKNIRVTHRSR